MGRGMQKDNEAYKSYYELYSRFNFYLEDAKGLLQGCKGNAIDNWMMEYTLNSNLLYYKNRTKMSIIIILFKIRFFGFQKWQNDDRFLNNETIFGVTSGEGAAICVLSGEDQKWALPTNQLPPPSDTFCHLN